MRTSGILLHISSLPSPYGIGTLGKAAYDFADFLRAAGQHYWQILPIGPTSYGDSPYQSFSTHAGNPYFIDLDLLVEEGLLLSEEVEAIDWGGGKRVDYALQYAVRFDLLGKAYQRGWAQDAARVEAFQKDNPWLADYALYMAVKRSQGMKSWEHWPEDIRLRREGACEKYAREYADDVQFFTYVQFLFFRQWNALRDYIHSLGLEIIGDLPIYVPYDSCDVWANPGLFQLNEAGLPTEVAGCPPDGFSADGQLWGNPLYNWDRMKEDGFGWWKKRIAAAGRLFDVIRIDHFRGLESYWAIPYGDLTARGGHWVKGPDHDFICALQQSFPHLRLIAEDLGFLTPEVIQLQQDSGFPGMKVLEFAFDPREPGNYLPHKYNGNCICYSGTHDNETLAQWVENAPADSVAFAMDYLGVKDKADLHAAVLRAGMSSVADTFIAQMQDYLYLGAEARMNEPGTTGSHNWTWRLEPGLLTSEAAQAIAHLTRLYER